MLQARSHKKEVILVHFRDREIGMALNMVLNLRKLTFEHFILLTLDEISCQNVLKAFPKAGEEYLMCVSMTMKGSRDSAVYSERQAIVNSQASAKLVLCPEHESDRSSCQRMCELPIQHMQLCMPTVTAAC